MTVSTQPDLRAVKAKQQQTWSSGDYSVIASRIVLMSERLADTADLRAGSRVLDVACGSGNATIAAARCGAHVVGVDYVPSLLETARVRAATEMLDVAFERGDAEALPAGDAEYDAALSVVGVIFAPDHGRTAAELLRVVRPGGTIALASWTPDGFIGEMFRTVGRHVPPPAGVASPLLWGTEEHLRELFGAKASEIRSAERTLTFRHESPEDFTALFRRWYGPTHKAFETLDSAGKDALARDLTDLARRSDLHQDGGSIALPSTYLESVVTLR